MTVDAVGLNHLDAAVLGAMFDAAMFPSRPHARTTKAIDHIAASKACGAAQAWISLQQLAAPWLAPMPLVDSHGNFGTMQEPASEPGFTECRLSNAGQLAVRAARGQGAALPIGLVNGDIHATLGISFDLWPKDTLSATLQLTPGFHPGGLIAAFHRLIDDPGTADDELLALVGEPWLLPFDAPPEPLDQLLAQGRQTITLTPVSGPEPDLEFPRALVALSLGQPMPDLLRFWLSTVDDEPRETAAALDELDALLQPGAIAPLPPRTA
ncbi:MAG: hypothetical protein ACHQDC_04650 [Acidimicrobiales bacterium]